MIHFLSIIPVKIHSDQFWENSFWLGLVFLKVNVQYKIHTTIFNFRNLQKNFMPFNYGSGQGVAYITLFVLCKHIS